MHVCKFHLFKAFLILIAFSVLNIIIVSPSTTLAETWSQVNLGEYDSHRFVAVGGTSSSNVFLGHVGSIESGILRYNGSSLTPMTLPSNASVSDIANNLAITSDMVLQSSGGSWAEIPVTTSGVLDYKRISLPPSGSLAVVVGNNGHRLIREGGNWSSFWSSTSRYTSVYVADDTHYYVGKNDAFPPYEPSIFFRYYDSGEATWKLSTESLLWDLSAAGIIVGDIWGNPSGESPGELYTVGGNTIGHYNGSSWTLMDHPLSWNSYFKFSGIVNRGGTLYAYGGDGYGGGILKLSGGSWVDVTPDYAAPIHDMANVGRYFLAVGKGQVWVQDECDAYCQANGCTAVPSAPCPPCPPCLSITNATPRTGTRNVDWENPGISVTFDAPYKQETVNENTFRLFYRGTGGNVYVSGTVEHTSSTQATFKPADGGLKKGVSYTAEISGKMDAETSGYPHWIEGHEIGQFLERNHTWSFWTMPELDVTVAPIQVSRGSTLVPGKPTVIRVYAAWNSDSDVSPQWQVSQVETDVSLKDENDNPILTPQRYLFKRSDAYQFREKALGEQSARFFGWTPSASLSGTHVMKATVEPLRQPNNQQKSFEGSTEFTVGAAAPPFSYEYHAVRVGAWAPPGNPPGNFQGLTGSSDSFLLSMYPFVNVTTAVRTPIGPNIRPNWSPIAVEDKYWVARYLYNMWTMSRGKDRIVGIVPQDYLGQGVLGGAEFTGYFTNWGSGRIAMIAENAHGAILSHEIGHTYGFEHDAEFAQDIDGVRLIPGVNSIRMENRSVPEGRTLDSVMFTWPKPPNFTWIRTPHYDTLLTKTRDAQSSPNLKRESMAVLADTQYLLVSGTIDENDQVYLEPWRIQEFANTNLPTGPYSIEFQDGSGTFLSAVAFEPSDPFTGTDGLAYSFFTLSAPLPLGAERVLIKHGPETLTMVSRSSNAPMLNVTSPTTGETLEGTETISWTGSDEDDDTLYYDVMFSEDGTDWTVLVIGQTETSYAFDTTKVPSGTSALLRVAATDGFNTNEQVIPVTVANAVSIEAVIPGPEETAVPISASIQIFFNSEMDVSTLTESAFSLRDESNNPATGSLTYDPTAWSTLFIPDNVLVHDTNYTALLKAGVADVNGNTLTDDFTWSFTTEPDTTPPRVVNTSPKSGAFEVPINTLVAVVFDEDMDVGSINTSTFTLSGGINGSVTYDEDTRTAVFRPSNNLAADTIYTVTLAVGIQDLAGNTWDEDYTWAFMTGSETSNGLRFTGNYYDLGANGGGGLYDRLIVDIEVEVLASATYNLSGKLDDSSGELIAEAATGDISLNEGVHTLQLVFPSGVIRNHGVDGPFSLTDLHLYDVSDTGIFSMLTDAYQTYGYDETMFAEFGDLDASGSVDLIDVILSLQVMAKMQVSKIHGYAEVNEDGVIGWVEAIYIIQKVSGLRE